MSIIPQFLDNALTPVAQEFGNQLSDIVSLAFTLVMMLKSKRDVYLETYIRELKEKVDKISEDNLIESSAHIVGPALEDIGKYYYDVQHVKDMYSNLICSSLDKNKIEMVHPSYIDIIKQMAPLEAKLFQDFFVGRMNKNGKCLTLIMSYDLLCYKKHNKTSNMFDNISILGVLPNNFLSEELNYVIKSEEILKMHSCFLNLERLKLVSISYVKTSDEDLEYAKK